MAALQRPPIPQSPLVDEKGFVTREWWRWFASIGVVVKEQGGDIAAVADKVETIAPLDAPLPMLDDPVDIADAVRQSLALRLLQDALSPSAASDPDQASLRALELTLQQDPVPLDQLALASQLLRPPADPVPIDQLMMLAQLLTMLQDPPPVPGAYLSNTTNTGNLTSTTPVNGASLALTPGDWDLTLFAAFSAIGGTVNATGLACGTSTTTGTFDGSVPHFATNFTPTTINSAIGALSMTLGPVRYSVNAATTVYGVVEAIFTLGTGSALQCTAYLSARKWR